MHLAGDLIGQDLAFPAFEGIERGPHNFLGRTLRGVDIARKVGVDESCMRPDDLRPRCANSMRRPLVSAHAADFDAP